MPGARALATCLATCLAACLAAGCGGHRDPDGVPAGTRVISGRLRELPSTADLTRLAAVQVVAIAPARDGVPARRFFSAPVAAASRGMTRPWAPFSLALPCDLAVNLHVRAAAPAPGVPGEVLAPVRFFDGRAATTLLPAQHRVVAGEVVGACQGATELQAATDVLDLGELALELARAGDLTSGVVVLGEGRGANPLAALDTDLDGRADLADEDDDDDGTPDALDPDVAGDGVPDAAQIDADGDGVADAAGLPGDGGGDDGGGDGGAPDAGASR